MNRRGVGYGGFRRDVRGGAPVVAPLLSLTSLGTDLLHHWRLAEGMYTTETASVALALRTTLAVATITDRAGSSDMATVDGAGTGPWYFGAGGAKGGPMMYQGARRLKATVSIATDHRLGFYCIMRAGMVDGARAIAVLNHSTGGTVFNFGTLATPNVKWRNSCRFNDGTDFADVDRKHQDWMLYAGHALATGGRLTFDGVLQSPNWTSSDDLPAADECYFGSVNTTVDGYTSEMWIVDNIDAEKHAFCVAYGAQEVGT